MREQVRLAMALWFVLAIVVFNVTFDWNVRAANHAFVRSQLVRHQRDAARHAAMWLAAIAAAGTAATVLANRGQVAQRHSGPFQRNGPQVR